MIKSSVLLLSRPRGAVINVQAGPGRKQDSNFTTRTEIWRLDAPVRVKILTTPANEADADLQESVNQ